MAGAREKSVSKKNKIKFPFYAKDEISQVYLIFYILYGHFCICKIHMIIITPSNVRNTEKH